MTVYLAIFSPRALLINTFEQDTQSLFPTSKDNINTLACRCLCIFKRLAWQCSDIASIPSCLHTFCCSGKLKTSCCYSTQPLSINVSHQLVGKAEKKIATCMIPLTQSAPYLSVYLHLLDLLVVKDVSSPCCGVVLFLSCVSQLKKLSSVSGY